jgi:hypothetical protein
MNKPWFQMNPLWTLMNLRNIQINKPVFLCADSWYIVPDSVKMRAYCCFVWTNTSIFQSNARKHNKTPHMHFVWVPSTHTRHPPNHTHTHDSHDSYSHVITFLSDIFSPFVVLTTTMPSVDGVFTGVPTKTTTRYKSDPPPTIAITYSATALL